LAEVKLQPTKCTIFQAALKTARKEVMIGRTVFREWSSQYGFGEHGILIPECE
jgi:hypothetical protein